MYAAEIGTAGTANNCGGQVRVIEEGCSTPKRRGIPVRSTPPPPPGKKKTPCSKREPPPNNAYFHPPPDDLQHLFASWPPSCRPEACV